MWENGNMRTHSDRKHVSFYAFPEVKEGLEDAVRHLSRAAPEQTRETTGRYQNTHHLEALVCWLLVQPQELQDRIILEGRTIARKLQELDTPAKDFPAAYAKPGGKPGSIRSAGSSVIDLDGREPDTQRRGGKHVEQGKRKATTRGR